MPPAILPPCPTALAEQPDDVALVALDEAVGRAYRSLRLRALDGKGRRACQGRWIRTGHDLAARAASCLRDHGAPLAAMVPATPDGILRQQRRVVLLQAAAIRFAKLAKDAQDSLLFERAALYDMSTAVLRGVAWLAAAPVPCGARDPDLDASLRLLRKDFAARNQRVSRGRRRGAERRTLQGAILETRAELAALRDPKPRPAQIILDAAEPRRALEKARKKLARPAPIAQITTL